MLSRDGGTGRRYQAPRVDLHTGEGIESQTSYVFTGKLPLHRDGRIWMVCDIEDPIVKNILYPKDEFTRAPNKRAHVRTECEISADGWFGNGTQAKVKVIMRNKIQALLEGYELDDAEFEQIASLPDYAETEEEVSRVFQINMETASPKVIAMATDVRAGAKSSPRFKQMSELAKQKNLVDGKEKQAEHDSAAEEKDVDELADAEQSEGEEEEIERAEILEDQVAAAVAARDAAEAPAGSGSESESVAEGDDNESDDSDENDDPDGDADMDEMDE